MVTVASSSTLPCTSISLVPVLLLSDGFAMVRAGALWSSLMVRLSVTELPAWSLAVTTTGLSPLVSSTALLKVPSGFTATTTSFARSALNAKLSVTVPATLRVSLLV